MTTKQRISTSFQGITVTSSYMTVHFAVGNGSWLRHSEIKVPINELLTDEVTQAVDKHVRRRMIEIWSGEQIPGLFDDEQVANNGAHWRDCMMKPDHEGPCS